MPHALRLSVLSLICLVSVLAQFEYGEILGTVRDATGAVVVGARVKLRSVDTNVERASTTNDEGVYSFAGLRIGGYELSVEQSGFKTAKATVPSLRVGDRLRIDIPLETGQITEQVTIVDEATPLLETDTSSRGQVIGLTQIRELPLNKRDYTQLVLLAPGTAVDPRQRIGGAINSMGIARCRITTSSMASTTTRTRRVFAESASMSSGLPSTPWPSSKCRPTAIPQSTAVAPAASSMCRSRAAATLPRDAVGVFPHDKLDAKAWTPTADCKRPKLRFNLFGANIGGPIIKDQTFFFVNYEGERERADLQRGNFNNVPISGALRIVPVDPTTGAPFPNGIIPAARFDPVSVRILSDSNFPVQAISPRFRSPACFSTL